MHNFIEFWTGNPLQYEMNYSIYIMFIVSIYVSCLLYQYIWDNPSEQMRLDMGLRCC